jgi:signal transduction histidine kinase
MRLSLKLYLLFLPLVALTVSLVGISSFTFAQRALKENAKDLIQAVNAQKESDFLRWIEGNKRLVQSMAQRPLVRDYAAILVSASQGSAEFLEAERLLLQDHFLVNVDWSGGIEEFSVIHPVTGEILVSTDQDLNGKFRVNEGYFLEGKEGIFVDGIKYDASEGKVALHITAPIISKEGELLGVLAGHVNLEELDRIMVDGVDGNSSLDTYLVNNMSQFTTKPRFLSSVENQEAVFTEGVNACQLGWTGFLEGADYRQVEVLGYYHWLRGWQICLVTEIDEAEAYQSVAELQTSLLAVSLVIALIGGLVSAGFVRSVTEPLTDLAFGAVAIGEGNLDYRVDPRGKDELGRLGVSFNQMAHNLEQARQENAQVVAELRQLSEELELRVEERTEDLQRSNEELERFAYVASHDLQEPLRMVTSYLLLLNKRYADKLDGDALEFINFAVDGATRMKRLINDLLAYSRVGTHGQAFGEVDLNKVLERAKVSLGIMIAESEAKVTSGILPIVMADEGQIEQVMQNLIGNAIKFSNDQVPAVRVEAKRYNQQWWQISVSDNGIGIDPVFFERIFVIFQRLHTREEYGGTGIGLAISKRIIERHGGRIWVDSTPGNGSTFHFLIPSVPTWIEQGERRI